MALKLLLPADWLELLKLLTSQQIKFVVSGGVAFSVHARPRYTGDLDLVISPDRENVTKFVSAFRDFGFQLQEQAAEQFLSGKRLLRVGVEPTMVDVMNFFDGVPLAEVISDAILVNISGVTFPVVSRDHLIANKLAVGRIRDLADVEDLKKK